MAAPLGTNTADADVAAVNAPLAAAVSAATSAAANVWPNTRDSYELREVIGTYARPCGFLLLFFSKLSIN